MNVGVNRAGDDLTASSVMGRETVDRRLRRQDRGDFPGADCDIRRVDRVGRRHCAIGNEQVTIHAEILLHHLAH